ncbi:non-specific lipid transfer protein GPI-anchored 10-like [Nymphaea colorata]|uniref:non-specific lipid transfer protein GPI-anchored 10-like n=1 Tax=Nymphaea colorata TaxID=210225 RepID=UPI00214E6E03|nr:non-specific lipid transfer protein GPI-anchored 10-like [Nymphaea colorata]
MTQMLPSLSGCIEAVQDPTKKPSSDCCKGVSYVVKKQMKCLCAIYNSPSTVSSFNITRLLEIPTLCEVPVDASLCKTSSPTASSSPLTSSSSLPAPTSAPPSNLSPTPSNGKIL